MRPQQVLPWVETHRLNPQPWNSVHSFDLWRRARKYYERKLKERETRPTNYICIKSHKSVIFHVVLGGTPDAISMEFGSLVCMVNFINFAKFDVCSFDSLNLARV
jgi:hypothetical protein